MSKFLRFLAGQHHEIPAELHVMLYELEQHLFDAQPAPIQNLDEALLELLLGPGERKGDLLLLRLGFFFRFKCNKLRGSVGHGCKIPLTSELVC